MTVHAARYGGALGPIFLLLIPGLALRGSRHSWQERAVLGMIFVYLILWASPFSSFQVRFLVPLTPFLAILAARRGVRCPPGITWSLGQICVLGVVDRLASSNLPPLWPCTKGMRVEYKNWLTHVINVVQYRWWRVTNQTVSTSGPTCSLLPRLAIHQR